MSGRGIRTAAGLAVLSALLLGGEPTVANAGDTFGLTTADQRIVPEPGAGFRFLTLGPGRKHVVRSGPVKRIRRPARPRSKRAARRVSVSYFGQLTDFQIADEESPGRLEYLDPAEKPYISGWRPQEALIPFEADQMVRQFNHFRTRPPELPGRGRKPVMDFVVNTGDLADNNQLNETRWSRNLMAGGVIKPGSGTDPTPELGRHPLCPAALGPQLAGMNPSAYAGVQKRSLWPPPTMGYFWDPDQPDPVPVPANPGFVNDYADAPAWPGLMDRAQEPFRAAGLDAPGYVALGNHDRLFQGNVYSRGVLNRIATGCLKPINDSETNSGRSSSRLPGFAPKRGFKVRDVLKLYRSDPEFFMPVPPDPARRLISRKRFIRIFRKARNQAKGHGFGFVDPAEASASRGHAGYYSFSPRRSVRFIVLDTTAAGTRHPGSFQGNVDNPQFRWLRRKLKRAGRRNQLVVVFSHHAINNLTARFPDEAAPRCGKVSPNKVPGCDGDPRRSTPIRLKKDLRRLMLKHSNVVAWVAGHSHVNRIEPHLRGKGRGGFWSIQTSSLADWPKQNRLFQLFDNRDGTLSLFGTLIDHAAPTDVPAPGSAADGFSPEELAAIGRTVGYNDSQTGGRSCPAGICRKRLVKGPGERPRDGNVELLLPDPRAR